MKKLILLIVLQENWRVAVKLFYNGFQQYFQNVRYRENTYLSNLWKIVNGDLEQVGNREMPVMYGDGYREVWVCMVVNDRYVVYPT